MALHIFVESLNCAAQAANTGCILFTVPEDARFELSSLASPVWEVRACLLDLGL